MEAIVFEIDRKRFITSNAKNIYDIWPDFEVYFHGGVNIEPYVPLFNNIFNGKMPLLGKLIMSEGVCNSR